MFRLLSTLLIVLLKRFHSTNGLRISSTDSTVYELDNKKITSESLHAVLLKSLVTPCKDSKVKVLDKSYAL